ARYQSNLIAGLPPSGIATARSQKPRSASPVSIHAGFPSLPKPLCTHASPSKTRITNHRLAERVSLKRKRAIGGSLITLPEAVLIVVLMRFSPLSCCFNLLMLSLSRLGYTKYSEFN